MIVCQECQFGTAKICRILRTRSTKMKNQQYLFLTIHKEPGKKNIQQILLVN